MTRSDVSEVTVLYMQCAGCSGCAVSVLNSASPTIKNVLIDELLPGKHINLRFHPTVMAAAGQPALQVVEQTRQELPKGYVLVVEGAIPTAANGAYGHMAQADGTATTMFERIQELAQDALATLALGTCAAFGGLSAAHPNPTGCISVREALEAADITTPLINLPGCPPHPDWFLGTIAQILMKGLPQPDDLDEHLRPKQFYGQLIHENCPRRAWFDEGKFASTFEEEGCLYELGCKGPITHADCPTRRWNNGVNWVIGNNAPCNGCVEPGFPDITAPFYAKLRDVDIPRIGEYWQAKAQDTEPRLPGREGLQK